MKVGAIGVGVAAALLAASHTASADWAYVSGATSLNLRACASVDCELVARLPGGAKVWIDGTDGGWYHVKYNDTVGFASARYISATAGSAVAPSSSPAATKPKPAPMPSYDDGSDDDASDGGGNGY
jgi:uncharacterized protein YgiM (DUF1202 family)